MGEPATTVREDLKQTLVARLDPVRRRQRRLLYWREAALSGWSPLGVFALALIPYMILVELKTSTYLWAQPVIQDFGLVMLAWFVGLWVVRGAWPRVGKLRQLRHTARELLAELDRSLCRQPDRLDANARERLVELAAAVDAARLGSDPDALKTQLKLLDATLEKQLGAARKQSPVEVGLSIALWLGLALLVRAVIIEPFRIPSGSMIPTLQIGDQIFVNKFIYGVRIPWANVVPFVIIRRPQRGDVVVFNNPVDTSLDFVKRVVGVPGDQIQVRNGTVLINGAPQARTLVTRQAVEWDKAAVQRRGGSIYINGGLEDPRLAAQPPADWARQLEHLGESDSPTVTWAPFLADLYDENLSGQHHAILRVTDPATGQEQQDVWPPEGGRYVVPQGHVFVMGDDRDKSADSRLDLGGPLGPHVQFVPYGNIKGKAMIIWLSLGHGGFLSNLFGGTGLKTERLFLPVR